MVSSGGPEHSLDCVVDAAVRGELGIELLASGGGEAVEANFAVGFGDAPIGGRPAMEEELLEGGVQGAFFNLENIGGKGVDALGYGVPV